MSSVNTTHSTSSTSGPRPTHDHPLRLAAVQLEVVLADVAANLAECESLAREAARAGAQAIALPEFFTTGAAFVPQLADAALAPDGAATEMLTRIARDTGSRTPAVRAHQRVTPMPLSHTQGDYA